MAFPDPLPSPILAWHTFGEYNIWYTFRVGTASWTDSALYANRADTGLTDPGLLDGSFVNGVSSGIEGAAPLANPRGFLARGNNGGAGGYTTHNSRPWYVGQGVGTTCYPILTDNIDQDTYQLANLDYWDVSHGAWKINGHLYCLLQYNNRSADTVWRLCMLKAISFDGSGIPTLWHACDHTNDPVMTAGDSRGCAPRWDGTSNTVDVFTATGSATTNYGFYRFDATSDTWGSAFGVLDFGRVVIPAGFHALGNHGASINRWANGDIGILYTDVAPPGHKVYYRLWAGGSWGSEITVKDYTTAGRYPGVQQVLPEGERLHVFVMLMIPTGTVPALNYAGEYLIVEHSGTLHTGLFTFPTRVTTTGFGHSIIHDGQIFTPWDDGNSTTTSNSVWVGPITGSTTTFVEELLPKPTSEAGNAPAAVYLIRLFGEVPPVTARNYAWIGEFARTA